MKKNDDNDINLDPGDFAGEQDYNADTLLGFGVDETSAPEPEPSPTPVPSPAPAPVQTGPTGPPVEKKDDYLTRKGGISVDEFLEFGPPPADQLPPLSTQQDVRSTWIEPASGPAMVAVDHEHLAKLDESLKQELKTLKEKNEAAIIPGNFLEARKKLAETNMLACPVCKIKVEDVPGKIDHCPQCGLALDDYYHQYRREWEAKYKDRISYGVKEFAPPEPNYGKTGWERWKEDKGVDAEAETLICPKCGWSVVDDPFIAKKCPKCRIPLDLHLQFPRPYVVEKERETKGHRVGVDKNFLENQHKLENEVPEDE